MGPLSGSDVLAGTGDSDHGDIIVVALQELLCAGNNVAHNDGGSEREQNMFVVGMQNKALINLAWKRKTRQLASLISDNGSPFCCLIFRFPTSTESWPVGRASGGKA